ncbi:MAG TPA: hypothetical protein VNS09_25520 [Solirubrobacter sp.]|nr:hypothetical protein [Solirubrobacter sp.]
MPVCIGGHDRPARLDGRTAIVTGAETALGRATAAGLAALGATVHPVDRRDVSLLARVRAYAATWDERPDILVHAAAVSPPRRLQTAEGHDLRLAMHVLGPHLLTKLLRPAGRVIWVTSAVLYTQRLRLDDLERSGPARTRRMQVALVREWGERVGGTAIHAVYPGRRRDAGEIVWLAAAAKPGRSTGRLWHGGTVRRAHYLPWTRDTAAERAALWDAVDAATSPPRGRS